jgi:hypothetical protein
MDETWLELGDVLIRQPVNAGTNLFLTCQCVAYGLLLRRSRDESTGRWSTFFLLMASATAAGVVKHGFGHELGAGAYAAILAISNVCAGLSTYAAQDATIRAHVPEQRQAAYRWGCRLQAMSFLAANVALGPELHLLIAHAAVGLVPVIVVESVAARDVSPGGRRIATGLTASLLSGVAYVGNLSPSPWFNHIDVAHMGMACGFHLILRGTASARAPEEARCTT